MDGMRIVQFAGFVLAVMILALIVRRIVAKHRKKAGAVYGIASINSDTDDPAVVPGRLDRPPNVGSDRSTGHAETSGGARQ
jgi:hypothetical protein